MSVSMFHLGRFVSGKSGVIQKYWLDFKIQTSHLLGVVKSQSALEKKLIRFAFVYVLQLWS